jgi:hypothetical protein
MTYHRIAPRCSLSADHGGWDWGLGIGDFGDFLQLKHDVRSMDLRLTLQTGRRPTRRFLYRASKSTSSPATTPLLRDQFDGLRPIPLMNGSRCSHHNSSTPLRRVETVQLSWRSRWCVPRPRRPAQRALRGSLSCPAHPAFSSLSRTSRSIDGKNWPCTHPCHSLGQFQSRWKRNRRERVRY